MKAVFTNFGTTGDLQPHLALASEFIRAGHQATIAFSEDAEARVRKRNIDFVRLCREYTETQDAITRIFVYHDDPQELQPHLDVLLETLPMTYSVLTEACRDADVLVAGAGVPTARMLHETSGIPFVSVQIAHFGGTGSPELKALGKQCNLFRQKLGLAPLNGPLSMDPDSPQLALCAISRHIRPPDLNTPQHVRQPGFFFMDDPSWTPPEELANFVEAADRLVVVSLGSTGRVYHENVAQQIAELGKSSPWHTVIQAFGRTAPVRLSEKVMEIGEAPHAWLLRRAHCMVHHGGGGTTGAALRAGVPMVIVPGTFDQPFWARLCEERGCSPAPLPVQQFETGELRCRIEAVLNNDCYARVSAHLGEKVRAEGGVRLARQLIEQLVRAGSPRDY